MPDTQLLDTNLRKELIREHVENMSQRFNEGLWGSKEKTERMKRMKPNFIAEFYERWDELDRRYKDYLDGKIDWDGATIQMEFMPLSKAPYPVLEIDRDILNYGRDLFCWFELQIKDL